MGQVGDRSEGTCSCAERTGELVVFTCPICCSRAVKALDVLTKRGIEIRVDSTGSVSGLELEREHHG